MNPSFDWPHFIGPYDQSRCVPVGTSHDLVLLWERNVPGRGYNDGGVIGTGSDLYVTAKLDRLWKLHALTGECAWDVGGVRKDSAACQVGAAIVVVDGGKSINFLAPEDGSVRRKIPWPTDFPIAYATPERLVMSAEYALDLSTEKLEQHVFTDVTTRTYPRVHPEGILVERRPRFSDVPLTLSWWKHGDSAAAWQTEVPGRFSASILYANKQILICGFEGLPSPELVAFRVDNGAVVWREQGVFFSTGCISATAVNGSVIFVPYMRAQGSSGDGLAAIVLTTGKTLWRRHLDGRYPTSGFLATADLVWTLEARQRDSVFLVAYRQRDGVEVSAILVLAGGTPQRFLPLAAVGSCIVVRNKSNLRCYGPKDAAPAKPAARKRAAKTAAVEPAAGTAAIKRKAVHAKAARAPDDADQDVLCQPFASRPAAELLQKLTDCGWFAEMPDAAVKQSSERVREATEPFRGLVVTAWDSECGDMETPYADLTAALAEGSAGLFQPTAVEEDLYPDDGPPRLTLKLGGQRCKIAPLELQGDYLDPDVLLRGLNKALAKAGKPWRFIVAELPNAGQEYSFYLTSPGACRQAMAAGLIPEIPDFGEKRQPWWV